MKRRTPVPIDDQDSRLFREAIGNVRQLDHVEPAPAAPKPKPYPHMLEADEAAVPGELLHMAFDPATLEVGEELSYLRDGYSPKLLRQLKRGQFSVQDDIDLHQMNAAAAHPLSPRETGGCRDRRPAGAYGVSCRHGNACCRSRQGDACESACLLR